MGRRARAGRARRGGPGRRSRAAPLSAQAVSVRQPALRVVAALLALGGATFAFVTTENLPIGLLPLVASDLGRSRSAIGFLMTAYAFTVALASVPLALATRRVPRRRLIVTVLGVFVVATALGAAAPTYGLLLASRLAIALAHAVFWAVLAPTAAGLVEPRLRGRALGIVFSGASLASVVGLPAATWLGQHTSWRAATLAVAGLGLAALVVVAGLLPAEGFDDADGHVGRHADARRYALLLLMLGLAITGTFAALTYITAFLTSVSHFGPAAISPILFVEGAAGVAAVAFTARQLGRRPHRAVAVPVVLLTGSLLGLAAAGHVRLVVVPLMAVFGFGLSGLAVSAQSRLLDVAPGNPTVASAGYSGTFNVGIGGGALVGGLLLPAAGVRSTVLVGGLLVAAALVVLLAEPFVLSRGSRGPRGRA